MVGVCVCVFVCLLIASLSLIRNDQYASIPFAFSRGALIKSGRGAAALTDDWLTDAWLTDASRLPLFFQMMKFAWDNYKRFAWGKNELRPLTRNGHIGNMFGEFRPRRICAALNMTNAASKKSLFSLHADKVYQVHKVCLYLQISSL